MESVQSTNINARLQTLAQTYIIITNDLSQKALNWELIHNTRSAIRMMAAETENIKLAADLYSYKNEPHITEEMQRAILHLEQQYALVQKNLYSAIVQCRKNEDEQEIRKRELRKRKTTNPLSESEQVVNNLKSLNEKILHITTQSHNVTATLGIGSEIIDRIHHEYVSKLPLALQGTARTLNKMYQRMQSDKTLLVIAMLIFLAVMLHIVTKRLNLQMIIG